MPMPQICSGFQPSAAVNSRGAAPGSIGRVAQAHRRVVGNVGSGYEFDALFVRILAQNSAKRESMPGVLA